MAGETALSKSAPAIRIGTSGYQYAHWRERFYPKGLPQKEWFRFYATKFDTVEINNTFYHLPQIKTFNSWNRQAPEHFCYAVKLNRYITHIKRLKAPARALRKFATRTRKLGPHLGPILAQLPPHWRVNEKRLEGFLKNLASEHRWCVEFRDERWLIDPIYELLKRYSVALCLHDMLEDHPEVITTSWTYLRFHGRHYGGNYSADFLKETALRIRKYTQDGLDVYAYFNNDAEGYAPKNAADLKRYLEKE